MEICVNVRIKLVDESTTSHEEKGNTVIWRNDEYGITITVDETLRQGSISIDDDSKNITVHIPKEQIKESFKDMIQKQENN